MVYKNDPLIIVLTPVKNEGWILDHFLSITSRFADYIIVADQQSTDNSVAIAKKYSKVILIDNNDTSFNEADRQNLLIVTARKLFGLGHILLALDADEIISADSLKAKSWDVLKKAPLGMVFRFDKPTIFFDQTKALYYSNGWPLGYKDDGAEHHAGIIHSPRVPFSKTAYTIFIEDIKFIHLCFVRSNVPSSKSRYYCCIENIKKVQGLRVRRLRYQKYSISDYVYEGELKPVLNEWFEGYPFKLNDFKEISYHWMDFEVLKFFKKYGVEKFYNDPIWHFNWKECKNFAGEFLSKEFFDLKIKPPSKLRVAFTDFIFSVLNNLTLGLRSIKKTYKSLF